MSARYGLVGEKISWPFLLPFETFFIGRKHANIYSPTRLACGVLTVTKGYRLRAVERAVPPSPWDRFPQRSWYQDLSTKILVPRSWYQDLKFSNQRSVNWNEGCFWKFGPRILRLHGSASFFEAHNFRKNGLPTNIKDLFSGFPDLGILDVQIYGSRFFLSQNYGIWFEMGPYGLVGAHIKTGKRNMAQGHFKTPPGPKSRVAMTWHEHADTQNSDTTRHGTYWHDWYWHAMTRNI